MILAAVCFCISQVKIKWGLQKLCPNTDPTCQGAVLKMKPSKRAAFLTGFASCRHADCGGFALILQQIPYAISPFQRLRSISMLKTNSCCLRRCSVRSTCLLQVLLCPCAISFQMVLHPVGQSDGSSNDFALAQPACKPRKAPT